MSRAVKTPITSTSSTRKAIMYSVTRSRIPQLAAMHSGIKKAVSSTNRMLIPSTPMS
jgi:hypothetical protein